jgi:TonB family protein
MWMRELQRNRDMTVAGTVQVTFRVTAVGKIEDLKIVSNTSNEAVANTCIYVITKVQLPPIPADALRNRSPWINIHLPLTVGPPR